MILEHTAASVLNTYVWALLKQNLGMKESDYGDRVPIIPAQQQPEFNQYNKAFLVYDSAVRETPNLHMIKDAWIVYTIYSSSVRELNKIMNVLKEALDRYDDSASDINNYTSRDTNTIGLTFNQTHVYMILYPEPEKQEGGRFSVDMTIATTYKEYYSVTTTLP